MSIKVVLFDLDGTLLPMDQKEFVNAYMGTMSKTLGEHGYAYDMLMKGVWGGMQAMKDNDGSCRNEEIFWKIFTSVFGELSKEELEVFDQYYYNEFQQVKESCGFDPKAAPFVRSLKEKGYRTVLATNPLFPRIATESRMRWAGLTPEDFDLYTTYENSSFCKPNLDYYREIVSKLGVSAEECLMVGNDVSEDMITEQLGMKVFLLTPHLINKENKDISAYPQGDFDDLQAFVENM